ncbi:MAG TPA: outer membrane beta-barrel protein [Chitinophagaceae bacterium]|nr:outer membrane beta-barrel protein [Chitinophagaceae bacterium]
MPLTKLFAFLVLCLVISNASFSQNTKASISGIIKDSAQKPLAFATVSIFRVNQMTEPVKTTYTNDRGQFKFSNADTGSFTLIVSHTGYSDKQHNITVTPGQATEVGEISLERASATLQGVTVTGRKPLVEQTDDKIVFNVENDPTAKTETAIDILRKTPFVSVDGEDNVQVNGQTNFKVLLNGKETSMFAQNVKEALKGFPGALIQKIEIITSPSAKYDAEGVGGIINIITKKKMKGYNGSLSGYYAHTGWFNSNMNFSMKTGKFGITMFQYLGGTNNMTSRNSTVTTPLKPSIFTRRFLEGTRTFDNLWGSGNLEVSYEIDSLNTLSSYANVNSGHFKAHLQQTITTDFTSSPSSISYYDQHNENKWPNTSVGLDYIRKFRNNKEKEFSIRFNGEFGKTDQYTNSEQDNPTIDRFVINNSLAKNNQYTIQSDFIQPLKNNQKLELGIKGILRRASSDFQSLVKYDENEDFTINEVNTDNFRYQQDVYSLYGSYGFKVGKTSFRLGLRTEHTEIDGDFISSNTKVVQSYTSFLPNVQSSTKFTNKYTLVATYSQRLQRPFIWNLNPFVNNNDSLNIFFGNPNLDAQTIHSLALQNRFMIGNTFFGITLTGSYSGNMITQYVSFDAPTGVSKTTSANIGKEFQLSLNGNLSTKFTESWTISINSNVRYNNIRNKLFTDQQNSGFGGNANINTSYAITKKFSVSSYFGFWRAPVTIQAYQRINIWYGSGMVYKLFKEKLSVNLSMANWGAKEREFRYTVKDPTFETRYVNKQPYRAIALSLTWNFGKLTENVSKKKGVSNDDLIGGGQSN